MHPFTLFTLIYSLLLLIPFNISKVAVIESDSDEDAASRLAANIDSSSYHTGNECLSNMALMG